VASGEPQKRTRAYWFKAPPELIAEVRRYWQGPLSPLIQQLLEEWLRRRRAEQLLSDLPEGVRRRLVERAGSAERAAELALKLLEGALDELEEEEEVQEAIGEALAVAEVEEGAEGGEEEG
jgi:hypothetical protein